MLVAHQVFEVQVRPGRGAGAADRTNQRALCHRLALAHADAAQVGVGGRFLVAVLHDHEVAVAAFPAGIGDLAVADRAHRRAGGGGEVHAQMRLFPTRDRMEAHAVAAADARERERRGQEGALEALAVRVVESALAAGFLEPEHLVLLAAVDEFGAQQLAEAQHFALGLEGLVGDLEAVARGEVAPEVDLAGEYVGQLFRHAVGQLGGIGGLEQAAAYGGAGQPHLALQRAHFQLGLQALGTTINPQAGKFLAVPGWPEHPQLEQLALVAGARRGQLAGRAIEQQAARDRIACQEGHGFAVADPESLEQALDRVVAPGQVAVEQLEAGRRLALCRRRGRHRRDRLDHLLDRQIGGIGCQWGHRDRGDAGAQQQGAQPGHQTARVALHGLHQQFETLLHQKVDPVAAGGMRPLR